MGFHVKHVLILKNYDEKTIQLCEEFYVNKNTPILNYLPVL